MGKASAGIVICLIGAGWASVAAAQPLPPAVSGPTGAWRDCVVRSVTSPHADASNPPRLISVVMRSCSSERNRAQSALEASGLDTVSFDQIEDYVREAGERALRARRAASQGPQGAPATASANRAVDMAYLQGRWCDSSNAWSSFDGATRQVSLPAGSSGSRVTGSYGLSGNVLTITGPTGSVTMTATRIDDRTMEMGVQGTTHRVRRC